MDYSPAAGLYNLCQPACRHLSFPSESFAGTSRLSVLGEQSLIIRVKPAPAASTPAVALYAFLVLALVVYINRLYLKIRTNRLQLEQEKSEKQRIEQSDEMNRSFFCQYFSRVPQPSYLNIWSSVDYQQRQDTPSGDPPFTLCYYPWRKEYASIH